MKKHPLLRSVVGALFVWGAAFAAAVLWTSYGVPQ